MQHVFKLSEFIVEGSFCLYSNIILLLNLKAFELKLI